MEEESEPQAGEPAGDHERAPSESESHRMRLTREQRKFLGPARSRHDRPGPEDAGESAPADAPAETEQPARAPLPRSESPTSASQPAYAPVRTRDRETEEAVSEGNERPVPTARLRQWKFGDVLQLQNLALLVGAIFVLFVVFYAGKKFDYWKYQLLSQMRTRNGAPETGKYADASANDLVEQAIVDERLGHWSDAAERFLTAKHKNLQFPGLLLRAAKLYYDHGDFDSADRWFERAIAFHEDTGEANYYRGMIATGRGDYVAGTLFYEAAASASPFNADYFYSWAEALRRDHRLKEAILRYRQAALRADASKDIICRFKARLAAIEAGDAAEVSTELDKQIAAGPLSVDWAMTQAALQLQSGKVEDAVRTINQARDSDPSFLQGHFAACAGDKFFSEAANHYPQLAEALRLKTKP